MAIKVLVFESDPTFAETLRTGLLEYGCEVSVVDDANSGLQAASRQKPELILLAIELPRMNGFSVCNKLKRDPALKDVPLIIMSSESTEETFEQHRRLRTRAEEYIHKPISFVDLVARIQPFVSLVEPSAPQPGADVGHASEGAIVLDDDIEIEDAEVVETVEDAPADVTTDDAVVTTSTSESMVDADVEDFAEQAFGALMDEPEIAPPSIRIPEENAPRSSTSDAGEVKPEPESGDAALAELGPEAPVVAAAGYPPEGIVEDALELEESDEVELDEVEVAEAEVAEAEVAASAPPPRDLPLPPSVAPLMAPAKLSSLRPSSLPPRAAEVGDVGKYREELEKTRARVKELEDEVRRAKDRVDELEEVGRRGAGKDVEVQRLQRELDEVKAKLASSGKGAGSAREFLDLREQLNKKDKEILDYKDQLSHKEKELLALRDSSLLLEREQADQSDRIAELEKQSSDLARAAEAAKGDKDQAVKRADDFKRKSEKTKVELDLRIAELGQLSSVHQAALAEKDEQQATLIADHQQALQEAEREKTRALAAAETAARERAEQARAEAQAAAEAGHERAVQALLDHHESSKAEAVAAREAELKKEHDARLAALHRANEDALGKLRAEHQQALVEQAEQAASTLAAREAEIIAEHEQEQAKEAADHSAALLALVDQKQASEAARDARIAALEAELQTRSNERDDAHKTISQLNERNAMLASALHDRTNERDSHALTLEERDARIVQLETELAERTAQRDQHQLTVEERDTRIVRLEAALAAASADASELNRQLDTAQTKLGRVGSKWSEDRASLERAKDALAAALAQIEEAEGRPFE
ncbi:MAG TPA: response regulator [Polyangiaceae bacterium]|nr:response regulator [Polyangiaceae bacterium]